MLSFEEGYSRIAALASQMPIETVPIDAARGRVLREDLHATRPHPAFDNSAMDGYALAGSSKKYHLLGEIAAGTSFSGRLETGQALRIFTGAPIPEGCDRVLIQENALLQKDIIRGDPVPEKGANIRKQGGDFDESFVLPAPRRLSAADLALIAAMNFSHVAVSRQPEVSILATGSELVRPGQASNPHDVIASNAYGLKALAENFGAQAHILPIIQDDPDAITHALKNAKGDLVVTTGGASVGKYDFVAQSAMQAGFLIDVHKIAIRPGKPIMAGKRDNQLFLGLPGNPISAMIGGSIFMRALLRGCLGLSRSLPKTQQAILKTPISANGERVHFMRAHIEQSENGFVANVTANQDSAAISKLASTNAMVMRKIHDPAKNIGDKVEFLRFG